MERPGFESLVENALVVSGSGKIVGKFTGIGASGEARGLLKQLQGNGVYGDAKVVTGVEARKAMEQGKRRL